MPTYEYKCAACGEKFERFQSMTAVPVRRCPLCKKNAVKRLISAGAGLIFKGSGFYITDYRSDTYKQAAKSDSGATSTSTTDAAKTESKPAAKTETPKPSAAPKKK